MAAVCRYAQRMSVLLYGAFALLVLAILLVPIVMKATRNPQRDEELRATMRREQAQREVALEQEKARIRKAQGIVE